MIKKKFVCLKTKANHGFCKLKKKVKSKKLNNLKLSRRTFFLGTLVCISLFSSTFMVPRLYALAYELGLNDTSKSKYSKLFPEFSSKSKKKNVRDYLPLKKMFAELSGKSPSAVMGILAAEITFQILRILGLFATIQVTRIAVTQFSDTYFAFSSFAARLARKKLSKDELFSAAIDGVTDAF